MNVLELPAVRTTSECAAPDWAAGCFVRRAITFFTGAVDTTTQVIWVQSRGLTFDLRLLPGRPRVRSVEEIRGLSLHDMVLLAEAEGGLARSTFRPSENGGAASMDWGGWVRAQLHDGWPEPGRLWRVGDCLIEFAPSGAYVEEWRAQPFSDGPLIGLVLMSQIDVASGSVTHEGGGLVIAGDHAGLVLGRPAPLPPAPRLVDLIRDRFSDPAAVGDVFRFEASYASRARDGRYVVQASTLPFREGRELMSFDGFTLEGEGIAVQRATEDGRAVERRFRIETCETTTLGVATDADARARAWLRAEGGTLLRSAR